MDGKILVLLGEEAGDIPLKLNPFLIILLIAPSSSSSVSQISRVFDNFSKIPMWDTIVL